MGMLMVLYLFSVIRHPKHTHVACIFLRSAHIDECGELFTGVDRVRSLENIFFGWSILCYECSHLSRAMQINILPCTAHTCLTHSLKKTTHFKYANIDKIFSFFRKKILKMLAVCMLLVLFVGAKGGSYSLVFFAVSITCSPVMRTLRLHWTRQRALWRRHRLERRWFGLIGGSSIFSTKHTMYCGWGYDNIGVRFRS